MTKTCPECGLSLQGRDNESVTCSDCLLEESLSNSVSKDDMSVSDKGLTDEQYKEKPIMNEDKEKYSGDLYGYEVMLRLFDEKDWMVEVLDNERDIFVDCCFDFENYNEALTEYKKQVNHLITNQEPSIYA